MSDKYFPLTQPSSGRRILIADLSEIGDLRSIANDEAADGAEDSIASDESELEPFADYKAKIEELLHNTGLTDFSVEVIQHGYTFQNCVYALNSQTIPHEQYILRVPSCPDFREKDGVCEAIINDAALLGYLQDKLPVPRVKAYSATAKNSLGKPFTIMTRLPGQSLNHVYDELTLAEKIAIVDQYVELLATVESITFRTAGTFTTSKPLSATMYDFFHTPAPSIKYFDKGDEEYSQEPATINDRAGTNLRSFLASHAHGWIKQERKCVERNQGPSFTIHSFERMLAMLDILDREGVNRPQPIVLNHWDLEPRNVMVEHIDGAWKICGVIDWDDTTALPRPLARKAPDWIWDWDNEEFTGYLNTDHQPNANLSAEGLVLKQYFDVKAAETLEGYLEDAYGSGTWLRRIWTFVREEIHSPWYIDLIKLMEDDWEKRPDMEKFPSSKSKVIFERALAWILRFDQKLRRSMALILNSY